MRKRSKCCVCGEDIYREDAITASIEGEVESGHANAFVAIVLIMEVKEITKQSYCLHRTFCQ